MKGGQTCGEPFDKHRVMAQLRFCRYLTLPNGLASVDGGNNAITAVDLEQVYWRNSRTRHHIFLHTD